MPSGMSDISFSAQVIGGTEFDTKAYLYELEDRIAICFNGTTDMKHFVTDIRVGQNQLSDSLDDAEIGEYVHEGFNKAFITMRAGIEHWLQQEPERLGKPVFCAGHSMGGAMATICLRYIAGLPQYKNKPTKLCLVTFGSPCVGNQQFADAMVARVAEMWRVVCENDIVPKLLQLAPRRCLGAVVTCCCCCCMICCCPKQLTQVQTQVDAYDHVGTLVLIACDGLMLVDPCFVDQQYMGAKKHVAKLEKKLINHYHYDEQFVIGPSKCTFFIHSDPLSYRGSNSMLRTFLTFSAEHAFPIISSCYQ